MDTRSKIILISGPTASGKSNFAVLLAKKLNGEIINADSMQIYKELKILTARPLKKDQKNIKHHLYGFQSVKKNFSAGEWQKLAIKKINEIKKRKKIPILVGGTGLYFKSITDGFTKIPKIPIKFRNSIRNLQKKIGQKNFYKKLLILDNLVKNKIDPNDIQRSIRAYEVKSYTKISLYKWFGKTVKSFKDDEFIKIYIDFPRADLVKKISLRVDDMFKKGAIQEVKDYFKIKVRKDKSSNKVIGLIEIQKYLTNQESLETVKDLILVKTRQYAKRQITWARGHMSTWKKIDPSDLVSFLKKI
tara:strand:- start:1294 stop:2202 length:909 start_codon:yes stop_codon:yes gene_type:complete